MQLKRFKLKIISSREPSFWNKTLENDTEAITSCYFFQRTIEKSLINLENAITFFNKT